MFDEFTKTQDFAACCELFLDGVVRGYGGLRAVCAEEIPGVEAGEVLEGSEDFVAADFRGLLEYFRWVCGCLFWGMVMMAVVVVVMSW